MSSAELAAWARVEALEPDDVSRALWDDRVLVKTWAMRGTLHLLPAAELAMWQAGFATYRRHQQRSWLKYFGVTADEVERLLEAISEALDGRILTREELATEAGRITGSPELGDKLRESWGALLKPAAFEGRLCFAPSVGQHVRFTRRDQWLAGWEAGDPATALPEITRRFFAVHGPGHQGGPGPMVGHGAGPRRAHDQGSWGTSWSRSTWPVSGPGWQPARSPTWPAPSPFRERVYRPQGWLSPVVLVGGRMEGVWSQESRGGRLAVRVEPFTPLGPKVHLAVEEEAERLAGFAGAGLDLTWA